MASKSPKHRPRNRNQPEFISVFSRMLKVKKIPNMNSPNQMEPFNKNIIRFGGLIRCQQHFSLFTARI